MLSAYAGQHSHDSQYKVSLISSKLSLAFSHHFSIAFSILSVSKKASLDQIDQHEATYRSVRWNLDSKSELPTTAKQALC